VNKTTYGGAVRSVLLTKYYLGDKMKENEVGVARTTYGEEESCVRDFGG
jgi:hypothetical protein